MRSIEKNMFLAQYKQAEDYFKGELKKNKILQGVENMKDIKQILMRIRRLDCLLHSIWEKFCDVKDVDLMKLEQELKVKEKIVENLVNFMFTRLKNTQDMWKDNDESLNGKLSYSGKSDINKSFLQKYCILVPHSILEILTMIKEMQNEEEQSRLYLNISVFHKIKT